MTDSPEEEFTYLLKDAGIGQCSFANWPQYAEGKERQKNEADHSRSVCGRLKKYENLHTRLVWPRDG